MTAIQFLGDLGWIAVPLRSDRIGRVRMPRRVIQRLLRCGLASRSRVVLPAETRRAQPVTRGPGAAAVNLGPPLNGVWGGLADREPSARAGYRRTLLRGSSSSSRGHLARTGTPQTVRSMADRRRSRAPDEGVTRQAPRRAGWRIAGREAASVLFSGEAENASGDEPLSRVGDGNFFARECCGM